MDTKAKSWGVVAASAVFALVSARIASAASCTPAAIQAIAPSNVTITNAAEVAATSQETTPFCRVDGQMVTSKAKDDFVNFEVDLPDQTFWNGRFQFRGNGGWGGELQQLVSGADYQAEIEDGYAVAATDTGHTAALDANGQAALGIAVWAVAHTCDATTGICTPTCNAKTGACKPNLPAVKDFAYGAVHKSTVAAQAIVSAYYNSSSFHSYFWGCSTGGRQALVEAEKYPADFDGILAGDPVIGNPFVDFNWNAQNFLQSGAYLTPDALNLVDQAVINQCGDPSGPAQGLVLNPASCGFTPSSLLCAPGQNTGCLNTQQVATLNAIYQGASDTKGQPLYPGYSKSDPGDLDSTPPDLSWESWITGCASTDQCQFPAFSEAEPWGSYYPTRNDAPNQWLFQDQFLKYFVFANTNYNTRDFGAFDAATGQFTNQSDINKVEAKSKRWGGDGLNPDLSAFAKLGHKLIITHGWSDPAISPFSSINYLTSVQGVLGSATNQTVRLFMVPGMEHCGGGPGPNVFDALTPMTAWVEQGIAPDGNASAVPPVMVASHFFQNDQSNPIDRQMPLCSYPEQPTYIGPPGGAGAAYLVATNWVCR